MNSVSLDALNQYVDERIKELYDRKLTVLESVSLQQLLSVNPYLLRAKNIGTAGEIIATLLDDYISIIEEDFFEGFLKELTRWRVQQTDNNHASAQPVIIELIGYYVQKHSNRFKDERGKLVNRLNLLFIQEFCEPSGAINWRKLVEHNSGNFDLDTL